jgi:predicted nucleic acid-binding protein
LSLILDASLALSWHFEDERTPAADTILDRVVDAGAIVPSLWRLEVANGFQVSIRRQRFDPQSRDRALARLARLPIIVDEETDTHAWTTTVGLADRFKLTVYDAAYLELALRRSLPLASLDRDLWRAAGAMELEVLGVA